MLIRTRLARGAALAFITLIPYRPAASQSVSWSEAALVPSITFQNALQTRAPAALIEWSPDSTSIISLPVSFLIGWLTIQDTSGQVIAEHALPSAWTYHELISTREVIMPGDKRAGVAFVVENVATGKVLFREMDPNPNAPGTASGTVRFALPATKSFVAVGYGFPRSDQPVTLYDTADWRKLQTLVVPADGPTGVGEMRLSDDGKELGFAGSHGLVVVDVASGDIVSRFPVYSEDFAFSSDGRLLAVAEIVDSGDGSRMVSSGLHVFRLSDGATVASRTPAGSPSLNNLRWDPRGRFLAFMSDGRAVHFWNPSAVATADVVVQLRSVSRSFALSMDGKRMAVDDGDAIDVFKIGD